MAMTILERLHCLECAQEEEEDVGETPFAFVTEDGNDASGQIGDPNRPFLTTAAAVVAAEAAGMTSLEVDQQGNQAQFVILDTLNLLVFSPSSSGTIADMQAAAGSGNKVVKNQGNVDIDTWDSLSTLTLAPSGVSFYGMPVLTVDTFPTALSGHAAGLVQAKEGSTIGTISANGATGVAPNGNGGAGGLVVIDHSTVDVIDHSGGAGAGTGNGGAGGATILNFSTVTTGNTANGGAGTAAGAGGALTNVHSSLAADSRTGLTTPTAVVQQPYPAYKQINAAGTVGAQTVNRPFGSVNIAAGQQAVVITNSFYVHPTSGVTGSIMSCLVRTLDATALTARISSAANGAFTITLNAAATAETRCDFGIIG